jgi:hypothetical protein
MVEWVEERRTNQVRYCFYSGEGPWVAIEARDPVYPALPTSTSEEKRNDGKIIDRTGSLKMQAWCGLTLQSEVLLSKGRIWSPWE